jgi:transketolase
MRKACLDMVYQLAKKDPRVFFIGSDLGAGTLANFKSEMPDRFFMEGVSEANLIGVAAGLALEGKIPYFNTIGTFITRRCFDQIAIDLCLHNVKVRLLSSGGGMVYAPLGPTHLAIEDLSILRALPNMTIIAPADAEEMKRAMLETLDYPGPIYVRIAKGNDPIVTRPEPPFQIGKAYLMRQGTDALLVTTGITLKRALDAASELQHSGVEAAIVHVPTLKPLDRETLIEAARAPRAIVTIEEHTILGGLGSAIAEVVLEAGFSSPKRFKRIGIPDAFPDKYGSQESLMERYSITSREIVSTVLRLLQN